MIAAAMVSAKFNATPPPLLNKKENASVYTCTLTIYLHQLKFIS